MFLAACLPRGAKCVPEHKGGVMESRRLVRVLAFYACTVWLYRSTARQYRHKTPKLSPSVAIPSPLLCVRAHTSPHAADRPRETWCEPITQGRPRLVWYRLGGCF